MADSYGLIGYPITHSFSPEFFARKFEREKIDATYELLVLPDIKEIRNIISGHPKLKGFNVTIPYKISIIPFLDELSHSARMIGAVNCVSVENGRLIGYNTDYIGFQQSFIPLMKPHFSRALILGTGGSGRAVGYALRQLEMDYKMVTGSGKREAIPYDALDESIMASHPVIINATPRGMYPQVDDSPPVPYEFITSRHLLFDLIYNPPQTVFLTRGKEKGATVKNGLEMLHAQAEASWNIWKEHVR